MSWSLSAATAKVVFNHLIINPGNYTAAACALSAPRLYRLELRAACSVAHWLDRHPVIFNALLWVLGIAFALEVFFNAPID